MSAAPAPTVARYEHTCSLKTTSVHIIVIHRNCWEKTAGNCHPQKLVGEMVQQLLSTEIAGRKLLDGCHPMNFLGQQFLWTTIMNRIVPLKQTVCPELLSTEIAGRKLQEHCHPQKLLGENWSTIVIHRNCWEKTGGHCHLQKLLGENGSTLVIH